MKYKIGEIVFDCNCDHSEIEDQVEHLLRYHKVDSARVDCQIKFVMDETLDRNKYVVDEDEGYLCKYAYNFLERTTQRFYYRVLLPLIEQICKEHNQLTVLRT